MRLAFKRYLRLLIALNHMLERFTTATSGSLKAATLVNRGVRICAKMHLKCAVIALWKDFQRMRAWVLALSIHCLVFVRVWQRNKSIDPAVCLWRLSIEPQDKTACFTGSGRVLRAFEGGGDRSEERWNERRQRLRPLCFAFNRWARGERSQLLLFWSA